MAGPLDDSYRFCQRLSRRTGRNFYWSFLTLPRPMFRDMCVLYAFMRHTDDLGDAAEVDLTERRRRIAEWRADLRAALHLQADPSPAVARTTAPIGLIPAASPFATALATPALGTAAVTTRADAVGRILPVLADVVHRRQAPVECLFDVITGVESDLTPRTIETFAELERYCYHVAGAVGLCCIHIWGFAGDARSLALDCGTAFQLTNILRDLQEDAQAGRVYLPREELQRFGVQPEDLRGGRRTPAFLALMEFQVARARTYYDRGRQLLEYLSPPGRRVHGAMLRIYGGLLDEIERRRYDVFTRRVELSRLRKLAIAVRSWW